MQVAKPPSGQDNTPPQPSSARNAAQKYFARGWQPIPIPKGSKNPNRAGWQKERRTLADLADFSGDVNVGILLGKPSSGLVDVDLDCDEAISLADKFLPQTPLIHGRPGRPRSHRWYVAPDSKTVKFEDTDGSMLVELRSSGCQTIAPPSQHPSGELLDWEDPAGIPPKVDAADLRLAVGQLASAALIARHWPAKGSRHDLALALAGALLRSGDEVARVEHFIRVTAEAAGDDEVQDRVAAVATTAAKIKAGEVVTGQPTLEQLIGAATFKLFRKWIELKGTPASQKTLGSSPLSPGQFELTESGTAERLISEHGPNLRFCDEWRKWLTWDGKRWRVEGASGQVQRLLKRTLRRARTDAARAGDKEMVAWFFAAEKRSTRDNIVSLARYEAEIQVEPRDLDASPMLFNCSNGTIDLSTAKLSPHQGSDLITQVTRVEYIPNATCLRWYAFLDRVFAGDRDLIAFVQRAVGYSLTGEIREHALLILWGSGANGKSTLLEVLLSLLGRYGTSAARDLLLAKTNDRHPTELADLFRARLVVCHETNEEQRFDESKLKTLTGGDRIKTRRMGEDFWEFSPTHKLWLGTNHRPAIRGTDLAIWRRIHLVPFEVTIPVEEQDAELPAKLKQELPGVLNWALEGCLAWQREGLNPPAKVRAAVDEYRHSEDRFGAFLADCCVVGPGHRAAAAILYKAFKGWAEASGEFVLSSIAFGKKLGDKGFQPITIGHSKARGWGGIGVRTDADSDSGPFSCARATWGVREDLSASVRTPSQTDLAPDLPQQNASASKNDREHPPHCICPDCEPCADDTPRPKRGRSA